MMERGQLATTQILAAALMAVPGSESLAANPVSVPNGITADVESATGDRYRITVEWLGDREGDAR